MFEANKQKQQTSVGAGYLQTMLEYDTTCLQSSL